MRHLNSNLSFFLVLAISVATVSGCDTQASFTNPQQDADSNPSSTDSSSSEKMAQNPADSLDESGSSDEVRNRQSNTPPGESGSSSPVSQQGEKQKSALDPPAHPFPRHRPAPSLDGGEAWLNTSAPLELRELRGKFVLLDFWTYCCINCIHVLPELKKLEKAYPNHLVVIGVHSAKFDKEKDSQNIREAIQRYEIEHPVVNDSEMTIWDRYGISSWPSMVLIDPEGNEVGHASGELTFEQLASVLDHALPYYRRKGVLDEEPRKFDLEIDNMKQTPLRFPGKVLADASGNRLFITDSNHNRIVITDLAGNLLETIGSGKIGAQDGAYDQCSFNHPQGLAIDGETLYVADTENHLLRKVNLEKKSVATIAGTGKQRRAAWPGLEEGVAGLGRSAVEGDGTKLDSRKMRFSGPPKETAINSPWALWVHGEDLFIAMAGPHQIWRMTLNDSADESEIGIYAGSGREDIVDGGLLPPYPYMPGFAAFAQPSGLASDGESLYVADSEGASIRKAPLPKILTGENNKKQDNKRPNENSPAAVDQESEVTTIVGTSKLPGGRLFVFGDRDGKGLLSLKVSQYLFSGEADQVEGPLLQHPLGVAYDEGKLYVADTYNDKIKVIDLKSNELQSIDFTTDDPENEFQLDEPTGLSVALGKLYIADTNNHRICVVDLKQNNRISELSILDLKPLEKTTAGE